MTKGEASQFVTRLIGDSCRRLHKRLTLFELRKMGFKEKFTQEDVELMKLCLSEWSTKIETILKPAPKPDPQTVAVEQPKPEQG